ncbi:MAG: RNA polymerase sigma factor [Maricaulaceae bacterium]
MPPSAAYSESDRVFDALLLTLARSGDARAAETLARRWRPRLMRTARAMLRNADAAEDAVQEAWAGICRGWLGLIDPERFPAWAFGVLRRKCVDQLRRRRHQALNTAPEPAIDAQSEDRVALQQALGGLNPDHRLVVILFFGEGLTLAEIARAIGCPEGTVKSRLFHARRQLQTALSGD